VKRTFKFLAIAALLAAIVFLSCDDGSASGGNKIFSLPYSLKFEHKDFTGGDSCSYILDCSYDKAYEMLTQKFGRWREQVLGPIRMVGDDLDNYFTANPDCVIFQDLIDFGAYRLYCDSSIYGGFHWDKPYEPKGTLRVTGLPDRYDGKYTSFTILDNLKGQFAVMDKSSSTGVVMDNGIIRNGIVDIPLVWFPAPSKLYDRSGTYDHGERYKIYLYIHDVVPRKFKTITFNNGSAEIDFNTGEKAPEGINWDPIYNGPDFEW